MQLQIIGSADGVRANNVICLARTYRKHAEELGNEVPPEPVVFLKPNSALVPDGADIVIPAASNDVHHEVELAVVIGQDGRHIAQERAYEHVLGYAILLDITARDLQAGLKKSGLPWVYAKGWDSFAPISPVTPRERVADPHALGIRLRVSGELRQDSNTSYMIHGVPGLIAYISTFMTLQRGDVIATGTPEGVGPLRPGDTTEAEIDGLGVLRNQVVQGK